MAPCPEIISPWWQWHPPVGVFIAVLAVLGVIVPWVFRPPEKMGRGEKAIWTIIMFLLLWLELRTLYLDRDEHDREQALARCQQLESFKKIANGIDTAISDSTAQFKATMDGVKGILTKQDKTLMQTMGGTNYPLFIATFPVDPASREMPVLVFTPGKHWPHGHIPTPEETAPLLDVTVDLTEHPLRAAEMTKPELESIMHPTHYSLGTVIVPGTFTAPFTLQEGKRYALFITTRRGEFREDISIDRDAAAPGGWRESWCMYGRRTVYKHRTVTSEETLLDGKCN